MPGRVRERLKKYVIVTGLIGLRTRHMRGRSSVG